MPIQIFRTASGPHPEIYITALPDDGHRWPEKAQQVFAACAQALQSTGARILQERIFAADAVLDNVGPIRRGAYGPLDDGIPPTRLAVPVGATGEFAGVLIHAVCSEKPPAPFRAPGPVFGRTVDFGDRTYVALSGISAPEAGDAESQARAVFERAAAALRQIGGDMRSVARTWVWLDDILSWYGRFNEVRNRFFSECGILDGRTERSCPPASTGIGVSLAGRPKCGLDVVAIVGEDAEIRHYQAAGDQDFALKYGSAFSRAACALTPGGETVYVSGTAAIDAKGATEHVGDPRAQIEDTLEHVRAVLRDMNCGEADVVQAIVYCKTPEVERVYRSMKPALSWPHVTVLADVCRDNLLFEVEATAMRGAHRLG
ncbi:MAG: Rid family hydrolase [Candidatus Sumerlaeia bacterium]|nr:Rid family hydrolase [Candidatus Sumerlaeia bacterium]